MLMPVKSFKRYYETGQTYGETSIHHNHISESRPMRLRQANKTTDHKTYSGSEKFSISWQSQGKKDTTESSLCCPHKSCTMRDRPASTACDQLCWKRARALVCSSSRSSSSSLIHSFSSLLTPSHEATSPLRSRNSTTCSTRGDRTVVGRDGGDSNAPSVLHRAVNCCSSESVTRQG